MDNKHTKNNEINKNDNDGNNHENDKNTYYLNSFSHLSEKDMTAIYRDCQYNERAVKEILTLISQDGIIGFDFFRVTKSYDFNYIGSTAPDELKAYFRLGFWQLDALYGTLNQEAYRIIDYSEFPQQQHAKQNFDEYLTLVTERLYADYKDVLLFNTTKASFNLCSFKKKAQYFQRLRSTMNFIYKRIHIQQLLTPSAEDINRLKAQNTPQLEQPRLALIQALYNLTEGELMHLKTIAAGGSAKDIARQSGRSYRYIQNIILELIEKLGLINKDELETIAQIIMTYED
ncbi:helix-turn-helix transcriptional regulator [Cysteiniphilum sp. 6C5]|uniref:helix-turn-helix transcriptional regulator n=1 Tax=unclassified Cysteiniphilum TaxID=2610889 RepID=UPI003F8688BF